MASQMGTFAETVTSITSILLPTKENKLSFSVSLCSKQTEICCFHFPFTANKWKLPFSVSSVFRIYIQMYRHIYILPFQYICICRNIRKMANSGFCCKRKRKRQTFVYIYTENGTIYILVYVRVYMPPFQTKNGSPGDFP